jgi:hypothetical protein
MDPDATLARIIDAAVNKDSSEMWESMHELYEWIFIRGGFPPADPRNT